MGREKILYNKTCLVTGAGRGIGQAVAQRFAEEGAIVYANDALEGSIDDWLKRVDIGLREQIHPHYFDICDSQATKRSIQDIKREQGRIDVLVNNAGIEFNEKIGMISEAKMRRMFEINVYAPILLSQLVARFMMKSNSGSIINISSLVGIHGNPGQGVYSATKGALIAFTKTASKELATHFIRVNSIAPGLTKTKMIESADEKFISSRLERVGFGRLAEPVEIANACLFLASDLSEYITGQVIGVDGATVL